MPTGVRFKLLSVVGVVALMTLLTAAGSWLFYSRIEQLLRVVVSEQMPSLAQALKVAEAASRFASGAPALTVVRNQFQRQSVSIALQQQALALSELIEGLRRTTLAPELIDGVSVPAHALEELLSRLNLVVEQRLTVLGRQQALERAIRRSDTEIDQILAAAIQPGRNGSAEDVSADRGAGGTLLGNASPDVALWTLHRLGAEMSAQLKDAADTEQADRLGPLEAGFMANRQAIEAVLAERAPAVAAAGGVDRLVRALEALASHGSGDSGLFALRRRALGLVNESDVLVRRGHELRSRLALAVTRLIEAVDRETESVGGAARAALDTGRVVLTLIAIVAFFGPMLLVWFMVGRTICAPLSTLAEATRSIAGGGLETPIPRMGRDELGALGDALGVFRDAMAALTASEARMRSILDAAVYPITITRQSDGMVVFHNTMASDLFQLPLRREGPVHAASFYCDPDEQATVLEHLGKSGRVIGLEVRFRRCDGTSFWALLSASIMVYQGENAILASFNDISELKRSEAELRVAKEQAERTLDELTKAQDMLVRTRKLAALGGLVAGVAHEINTPVGIALTATSHLVRRIDHLRQASDEGRMRKSEFNGFMAESRELAAISQANVERTANLIDRFKQLAVDQHQEERQVRRMLGLIHDAESMIQSLLLEGGHRLEVICPPELEIDSYPDAIIQVLIALLTNSVDHGYPDNRPGRLVLTVNIPEDDAETIELCYQDDGCGIAPEYRDRVFEPFFTTRRGQGRAGLGLYNAFNLVTHRLRGDMVPRLTGEPRAGAIADATPPATEGGTEGGSGVCFILRLPRRPTAADGADTPGRSRRG